MNDKYILLYDGECGFCNYWVNWVMRNDKKGDIHFASLQGDFVQNFLSKNNLPLDKFNTLYLIHPNGKTYKKSDAILKIGSLLKAWYKWFGIFKIIPKVIRDKIYDLVAKNRKHIRTDNCTLPTKEQRARIIN